MKAAGRKQVTFFLVGVLFVLTTTCHLSVVRGDEGAVPAPGAYGRGLIPLTPGSSTTLQNMPGEARTFVTVLALGAGTLKATLSKKDTANDVVSMILIGYPADPVFVPGFGITPADLSLSTAVTDTLGGVGVIFIITTVNSTKSYASSLSLKLE